VIGWRTAGRALTREGVDVGVRCRETVRKCLQEGHDQVPLVIREAEVPERRVHVVPNLGHWPTVHLFRHPLRAVARRDVKHKLHHIARIVEVDELL
jgi:hypothetical protein